jgi:MFS family permease
MKDNLKNSLYFKIPISIWMIGFASLLFNSSSVIVFSLSAVYLKNILGIATGWIAILEGLAEGTAYLTKLFSGILSDVLKRRKWIMVAGFGLSTLARPLMAFSLSYQTILIGRILDRIGNGVQATPRDALVGDLAPEEVRGTSYGLRQGLATLGSFLGGILGIVLLKITQNDVEKIFQIVSIPVLVGFFLLIFFVKDAANQSAVVSSFSDSSAPSPEINRKKYRAIHWCDLKRLGSGYWILMGIGFTFMLARVGEAFLILHGTTNFQLEISEAPYVVILYNATYSLISFFIGRLSDQYSRTILLACGILTLLLSDLILILATCKSVFMIGVGFWGIQMGITQSLFLILIIDLVPNDLRGTSDGFFHLLNAIGYFMSSIFLGGLITQMFGERAAFSVSALIAFFSFGLLIAFIKKIGIRRSLNSCGFSTEKLL